MEHIDTMPVELPSVSAAAASQSTTHLVIEQGDEEEDEEDDIASVISLTDTDSALACSVSLTLITSALLRIELI